jgi:hypothetical protein
MYRPDWRTGRVERWLEHEVAVVRHDEADFRRPPPRARHARDRRRVFLTPGAFHSDTAGVMRDGWAVGVTSWSQFLFIIVLGKSCGGRQ